MNQGRGSVAIVGAGVGGLACARVLGEAGWRVSVFDKSRGLGGRCSTRRASVDGLTLRFDHGAQYFTARTPAFQAVVEAGLEAGSLARWRPRLIAVEGTLAAGRSAVEDETPRYVGVPGMSALGKLLAARAGVDEARVHRKRRIQALERGVQGWTLVDEAGERSEGFEAVLLNLPSAQATPLLEAHAPALAERSRACTFEPCWAGMLRPEDPALDLGFDAAFVSGGAFSWVADGGSKPGRSGGAAWVLHADPDWTRAHLEEPAEAVARELHARFEALVGRSIPAAHRSAHRWRFAKPEGIPEPHLLDADLGLGVCGDWCGGPRVEGAFTSGRSLAQAWLAARTA
ncbi:probable deoxyribodipyrimidine photolyase [Plesiocystis pacifica SIR-1]|uniref:Probable deoxyribodipyrimidine photolyase n=1 Tax=Plesiocystis pacifica SIR-1 TaxID=391625 RepID=A6G8G3_9BACT|nr:NAD(P)-binding protein [Plesiocystis pacifica]EDM77873.1 probable deoxyribodipyrimidine photolyase [Plesiocystis pacifica SIR-1]